MRVLALYIYFQFFARQFWCFPEVWHNLERSWSFTLASVLHRSRHSNLFSPSFASVCSPECCSSWILAFSTSFGSFWSAWYHYCFCGRFYHPFSCRNGNQLLGEIYSLQNLFIVWIWQLFFVLPQAVEEPRCIDRSSTIPNSNHTILCNGDIFGFLNFVENRFSYFFLGWIEHRHWFQKSFCRYLGVFSSLSCFPSVSSVCSRFKGWHCKTFSWAVGSSSSSKVFGCHSTLIFFWNEQEFLPMMKLFASFLLKLKHYTEVEVPFRKAKIC